MRRSLTAVVLLAASVLTAGSVAAGGANRPPALSCGEERWPVKTLSDPDADEVSFKPKATSVRALTRLAKPRVGDNTPRMDGVEKTTYRVTADLVDARHVARKGEDRDIHLVIADPRDADVTMIVEFPDVRCEGATGSKKRAEMRKAREAFERACGKPPKSFVELEGRATITGVGFIDQIHGQRGIAPNGIELHPVLRFKSSGCRRS